MSELRSVLIVSAFVVLAVFAFGRCNDFGDGVQPDCGSSVRSCSSQFSALRSVISRCSSSLDVMKTLVLNRFGKPLPDGRGSVKAALISCGLPSRDRQGRFPSVGLNPGNRDSRPGCRRARRRRRRLLSSPSRRGFCGGPRRWRCRRSGFGSSACRARPLRN